MASFDFVESASKGYKFVWDERVLILQIALLPLAIKLVSFIGITVFDFQSNYLRQGLFLLPAYAAEGWLLMQLIRFAILGERGHANLTGNEKQDVRLLHGRRRGILAGTIIYVLMKLLLSMFSALIFMGGEAQNTVKPVEVGDFEAFIGGIGFFVLMLWGFRLVWLYVPAALDCSIKDFLWRIKSFSSSFSMIGVWLLSFVPIMLLLIVMLEALSLVFPEVSEGVPSSIYKYSMVVVQGVLDLMVAIVSSVGMAYGIKTIYDGTNKPTPLL